MRKAIQPSTNILVTGSAGQVGSEIKVIADKFPQYQFYFTTRADLDIADKAAVELFFKNNKIDYCINCAAYTAVDKAEAEQELAEKINKKGVANIAEVCKTSDAILIHLSTDYVFDGKSYRPYIEDDPVHPLGVYGKTKAEGEQLALTAHQKTVVIRTSWVYSSFGNNFVKTMLRLSEEKQELNIVADQIGSPTYACDIAKMILEILPRINNNYGIYHYTNEGVAGWYDFAKAIFGLANKKIKVHPISTKDFPTPAQRPLYSVLNKSKIKTTFALEIPYWKDSLVACLGKIAVAEKNSRKQATKYRQQ